MQIYLLPIYLPTGMEYHQVGCGEVTFDIYKSIRSDSYIHKFINKLCGTAKTKIPKQHELVT